MDPHSPQDHTDDEISVLLSDPAFVERTITSDPFIDWNLRRAINGIYLSREDGAMMFLQNFPHYIEEFRDTLPTPLPPVPPKLAVSLDLPDLWRSFVNSDWHRNNENEPNVDGYSVLRQMLVQQLDPTDTQPRWICGVPSPRPSQSNEICGKDFRRWDRAITHIRAKHLDHRPHACGGGCGVPTCEERFTSRENVHQHRHPQRETCECGRSELRQNMARHKRHCSAQGPSN